MSFKVDENGNITCVQGDSGEYVIEGVPTDKNYTAYFGIYDKNRKTKGTEIEQPTNFNSTVKFILVPALTNLLTVPIGEETAEYYFGIKLCYENDYYEDTLLLGNSQIGDLNTITVYPKKVEGTT